MTVVIRRLVFIAVALVALSGCAGSDRTAIAVGETAISEDGLLDMVLALGPPVPEGEAVPFVDAAITRQIAGIVATDLASVEYLRQNGIELTDAEREDIKGQIEAAISEQRLGPIDRTSEGYEALTYNVWIASQPADVATPEAQQAIAQLLRDADVSSRVGTLNPDTRLIDPRG